MQFLLCIKYSFTCESRLTTPELLSYPISCPKPREVLKEKSKETYDTCSTYYASKREFKAKVGGSLGLSKNTKQGSFPSVKPNTFWSFDNKIGVERNGRNEHQGVGFAIGI